MKITDLLSVNTIDLKAEAKDKTDVIKKAVKLISKSGAIKDIDAYQKGVFAREKESTTGVGEGIAIPHCKNKAVAKPALAAMVIKDGVDYQALDNEPVKLLFLIAAPNVDSNVHLEVLARLSNLLMHEEFKNKLLKAKNKQEFLKIIDEAESEKKEKEANKVTAKYPKILAATSCPTGVAHTYMAQEALEKAAAKMGYTIKVETNGTGGAKNVLSEEEIEHAEVIIVAADAFVEVDRFTGKKMIEVSVSRAIKDAEGLIKEALSPKTKVFKGIAGGASSNDIVDTKDKKKGGFHTFYRHLMSGISHMIPFVIAGGICLALAYLIDGCCGVDPAKLQPGQSFGNVTIGAQIFHFIGADFGLGLMLPVLGGFIAYSIAGKPGLVAGFIGAFAAKEGRFSLLYFIMLGVQGKEGDWVQTLEKSSSGFLGAIIAGFLAGYIVLFFIKKTANMPRSLAGVKDMLLMPLFTSIIIGALMLIANIPLAFVNIGIAKGLTEMSKIAGLGLLLGALVAGLMAIDMGGPINKATHFAVVALVTTAIAQGKGPGDVQYDFALKLNAANLLGMLTPPAGIAIATWLFPQKFTKGERNPSIANLVTGCCGITEGAIPFVVKNPISTVVSTVVGAACGGMISMTFGFTAIAPEGGFIGMVASNPKGFWMGVVSCAAGAFITAILLGMLRKNVDPEEAKLGRWKGIPIDVVVNPIKNGCLAIARSFRKKDN